LPGCYTAGKITEQKLHTIIANAAQYQKDSTPPKPPGLADSLTTPLLIIGGIAALVVFGPSIANAFGARTQRRAA
jgi:hypothetical protein